MQRHDFRFLEQRFETPGPLGTGCEKHAIRGPGPRPGKDPHSKGATRALRDCLPNATETDQAQGPSGDAAAELICRSPSFPVAVAQQALSRTEPAQRHHHQRDGEVGRTVGKDIGRVGHHESGRFRSREVDMIDARAKVGENPAAVRAGQQDLGAQGIEQSAQDPVGFREGATQFRG